jgi:hypothetical protein
MTSSENGETDKSDIEREIQRIEEGEAWDETDEVIEVEVKRPLEIRRVEAARELGSLQVEDVPDPETLNRQLEGTYESSPEAEPPA